MKQRTKNNIAQNQPYKNRSETRIGHTGRTFIVQAACCKPLPRRVCSPPLVAKAAVISADQITLVNMISCYQEFLRTLRYNILQSKSIDSLGPL